MKIYEELDGSYVQLTDVPDLAVRNNNLKKLCQGSNSFKIKAIFKLKQKIKQSLD